MVQVGPTLQYRMPETVFTATVTRRMQIVRDDNGSLLFPVVDVALSHAPGPDLTNGRLLAIDAGLLEKLALTVALDGNGLITAVNSETSRDFSPVISLVGKAVGLAASLLLRDPEAETRSLEQQWADTHAGLAGHLEALLTQVDRLLATMSDAAGSPHSIATAGRALDAVQSQVASISQVRRDWIVGKAGVVDTASVTLRPFELLRLHEVEMPDVLDAPDIPSMQSRLADDFSCLVAVIDPDRGTEATSHVGWAMDQDVLCLRRSRPVTVGIYLKGEDAWSLDQESVQRLNVVDRFSEDNLISLDGSWFRTKSFELAYNPDMSVKTFGVKSVSSVSAVATSLGEVFDAAAAARDKAAKRPSAAAQELAAARARLDLLNAATEYEVLSATRERAAAVAIAEQLAKLR